MHFALIGYPLGHSLSPFIHKELFALSGADADYKNIEIPPEELSAAHPIFNSYDGINVTIPHKLAVIPFLTELKEDAAVLKTVNTIVFNKNGTKYGYNTDCKGFLAALQSANINLQGKVLLCGYGGTSRMMCYLAAGNGCDITIVCRESSIPKAQSLADEVLSVYPNAIVNVQDNQTVSGDFDLLLNGTPAGMYPKNISLLPVDKSVVEKCSAVFDAVYNPRETRLLKTAKASGAKCAYGMPMLVHQAAAAQKIWYGADFKQSDLNQLIEKTNKELERVFTS